MNKLDYGVLDRPITNADIVEFKQNNRNVHWILASYVPAQVASMVVVASFMTMVVPVGVKISTETGVLVFMFGVTAASIAAGLYVWARQGREHVLLDKFARTNGAAYSCNTKDPDITAMLFDVGHTPVLKDSITFENGMQIGAFKFLTGSGKSQRAYHRVFASIPLSRQLPHMVLDASKNNNILIATTNLPGALDKKQRLSLEGDFDKYFTLYVPQEYETDALYIFTPDVMQAALENGGAYDMEVIDDRLYIYKKMNYGLAKPKVIKSLLDIIDNVGQEFAYQGRYYVDARAGSKTKNTIAGQGQRLKMKQVIAPLIITLVVGLAWAGWFIFSIINSYSR